MYFYRSHAGVDALLGVAEVVAIMVVLMVIVIISMVNMKKHITRVIRQEAGVGQLAAIHQLKLRNLVCFFLIAVCYYLLSSFSF